MQNRPIFLKKLFLCKSFILAYGVGVLYSFVFGTPGCHINLQQETKSFVVFCMDLSALGRC
jgi:hypothetical protein